MLVSMDDPVFTNASTTQLELRGIIYRYLICFDKIEIAQSVPDKNSATK
jgi:hypothetical protein